MTEMPQTPAFKTVSYWVFFFFNVHPCVYMCVWSVCVRVCVVYMYICVWSVWVHVSVCIHVCVVYVGTCVCGLCRYTCVWSIWIHTCVEVAVLDDKLRNTTHLLSDRDSHWSGAQQRDWLGASDSRLSLLPEGWDSKCMPLGLILCRYRGTNSGPCASKGRALQSCLLSPRSFS